MEKDSVARDIWFMMLFGVLPASGLLIGGTWIGGWVLGESRMPWAALVVVAGVFGAFGVVKLATQLVDWGINERYPCP
jgi:flagellar motor component MotA